MPDYVYRWMDVGGRPLAILYGDVLFDGSGSAPLVCLDGNKIFRGQFQAGAYDFILEGDHVRAGSPLGPIVFTIIGNDICDGMGVPRFLTCPTGNRRALAAAAVAFIGDLRLRQPGADVVDRQDFETETGSPNRSWGNSGVDHKYYGNYPDPYYGKNPPSDLTRKFGDQNFSKNANDNLALQGKAVSSRDNIQNESAEREALNAEREALNFDISQAERRSEIARKVRKIEAALQQEAYERELRKNEETEDIEPQKPFSDCSPTEKAHLDKIALMLTGGTLSERRAKCLEHEDTRKMIEDEEAEQRAKYREYQERKLQKFENKTQQTETNENVDPMENVLALDWTQVEKKKKRKRNKN